MNKRILEYIKNNGWIIIAVMLALCSACIVLSIKGTSYFKKNIWDFIAVIIAFFSFCVALRSYFIAKRTLRSQQQTEINTTPLMNKDVQNFLMKENLFQLYDAYNNLSALKCVLEGCHYSSFPYGGIKQDLEINSDFIHLEIFYTQVTTYHMFKGFTDTIRKYNTSLSYFFNSICKKELNESYYAEMMDDFIESVNRMVHYWIIIMKKCYLMNEVDLSEIMNKMTNLFEYDLADNSAPTVIVKKDNNFVEFYPDEGRQDRLIKIMNFRVKEAVEEFSKQIIDYERD